MTSVREALNIMGQSISIRQLAHQQQATFPLSLRQFVGASPSGQVLQKVIPLDLLQRKFDVFFNQRLRPLFQLRFDGKSYGRSTLTAAFDNLVKGYDHEDPIVSKELAGPGEVLEFCLPPFGTPCPNYHFSNVNSDGITLTIINRQPVMIEAAIHFEIEGEELKVNNFPNINFTGFNIKIQFQLELDSLKHTVTLATSSKLIKTNVSVDVSWIPDGVVADKIKSTMSAKISAALNEKRDDLNQMMTTWLVGGDFPVVGMTSDEQALTIDYILPGGQLEPFPEHPQPPLDPGPLANIDHIVVLMMENRSFDHMLGYLSKEGERSEVDGLRGGEKNRYKGRDYPSFLLPDTQFFESPPHEHASIANQINGGKLDGFVSEFAKKYEAKGVEPGRIMGYHNAAHVPVYDTLAKEFLICQRWFAAHPGPTFCNRFYTLTGRLNRDSFGSFQYNNPSGDEFKPVPTKTIFDHLSDRGVSWHYYEHRYCFLRLFERYTFDNQNIVDARDPTTGFFASAQAGTLPAVSFIDPNFVDEPDGEDNDDGAPADITKGQQLISDVVQALIKGPKWHKTLLVITYDEHGGFYDHVNPLEFREKAKPVSGIDHYGARVPTFVISPWVERKQVSNIVFDHTSIAKTICKRFMSANPPDLGERVAAANDLSMVLQPLARQDTPSIPRPPDPIAKVALLSQTTPSSEIDDFKEILRTFRARYPLPPLGPMRGPNQLPIALATKPLI